MNPGLEWVPVSRVLTVRWHQLVLMGGLAGVGLGLGVAAVAGAIGAVVLLARGLGL